MSNAFRSVLFTPHVLAMQTLMGSREMYEEHDDGEASHEEAREPLLSQREARFIEARDGFYQATVSETGWPYVQFRGGPAGFLKVLDANTIGYADFRGNVQYISVGNLQTDDRVSIILMDYANQRRLKLIGRARLVDISKDDALRERLQLPGYRAKVERAVVISLEGFDWNCPQHITPRFTEAEIASINAPLLRQLDELRRKVAAMPGTNASAQSEKAIGDGPLAVTVTGLRQLTPRVLAVELQSTDGSPLPAFTAGAHLDVPVVLADGAKAVRQYSISSNPARRDRIEIAVLREPAGRGGSKAVHANFRLGMKLLAGLPKNDFKLHEDARPAVLIAGGIGITPLRAMAKKLRSAGRAFHLHYAARGAGDAAYLDELRAEHPDEVTTYLADAGQRLDARAIVNAAASDSVFYVCGPASLIDAVRSAAHEAGVADERVRSERFVAAPELRQGRPVRVILQRSGKTIDVKASESILDAVEDAGVDAPSSCRSGTCGTCAVKVLAGEVEHRDTALSDEERERAGLMCICVSRAKSDELRLDL
jgi:ferredoxin-NADP reductase/predicted pyridoxine 5'-phosphate oxidase superfamily flavin-nucleotide-binding protein